MSDKDEEKDLERKDENEGKKDSGHKTIKVLFDRQKYEIKYISRELRKKHTIIRRYIVLAVVVAAGFFGLKKFFDSRKVIEYMGPAPAVNVMKPQMMSISKNIMVNAYVEADSMIPVVPFVSGTILEYPISAGDYVKEGDILAVVDPKPYREQLAQAEAAYLGYLSTFERVEKLHNANAASQQDYDSVKAQKDAYEAQFNLAKIQLDYTNVTAPVSGTILKAPLAKGSIGDKTIPLAVIADLDKLVVRANVPEKYFAIFLGDQKNITADVIRPAAKGVTEEVGVTAKVKSISPYVEPAIKTFEVTLELENASQIFRPGMFVKVKFDYDRTDPIPVITQKAKKNDGSYYVYDDMTLKVRWEDGVELAENSEYFQVPDKYRNSYIVVSGQGNIFDGQEVNAQKVDAESVAKGGSAQ